MPGKGRQAQQGPAFWPACRATWRRSPASEVQYVDISPRQTVGVSAALIPFLEHDDANRALMGSNMQRQAVPLLRHRAAAGGHRPGKAVAQNSGMVVRAERERRRSPTSMPCASLIDNADEYVAAQVRRPQRADLPEPEADRQDGPARSRRARSSPTAPPPTRASWPWAATCWWPS